MSIDATTIRQVKVSASARSRPGYGLASACTRICWSPAADFSTIPTPDRQIAVGQWILDRGAMPRVDVYSFSMPGESWVSSSWLAQVLYAASYNLAGWAGPVVVAAGGIAATFALLAHILERRVAPTYAILVALAAVVLSMPHFLARPHVLAMPLMVASGATVFMIASEWRQPPSYWLLPLIALWANLHGGFCVRSGAGGRLRNRRAVERGAVGSAGRWCCAGGRSGWLRWRPAASRPTAGDRSSLHAGFFDLASFAAAAAQRMGAGGFQQARFVRADDSRFDRGGVDRGIKLSPPRIALVLGLLHMALSHSRNLEIFALLLPICRC